MWCPASLLILFLPMKLGDIVSRIAIWLVLVEVSRNPHMKLGDIVSRIAIDTRKLTDYALDSRGR